MPLFGRHGHNSPTKMGFMTLDNGSKPSTSDIALARLKSNASSGARKPGANIDAVPGREDSIRSFRRHSPGSSNEDDKPDMFGQGTAGRRKLKKNEDVRQGSFGPDDEASLNAMGRLYHKIVNFSVVTRYLIYVLPFAVLLSAPLITFRIIDPDNKILVAGSGPHRPPVSLVLLWVMIGWLSLWVGKIVAHLLPAVFMFFCGVVSSGTRKYATVLRALEIPLSIFFWALGTWLSFGFLLRDAITHRMGWELTVQRILGALCISSIVLLVEKTIVQLISITYHQRSFANRIKESKREVYLLGLMYDASRTLFPMYCPEFADDDYVINDTLDLMLSGKKKGQAAAPMRIIGDVGRFGDKLTSVFGNIASEITGKQVFNPTSAHSIVVEALEKVSSSEALAKRIWMSFVIEGNEVLYERDLAEVLGPSRAQEAHECFSAIDADENGDISLEEMIRKVLAIGKERKDISNSMKDISQALAVFDKVLLFVVCIIVVIIFLIWFESKIVGNLAAGATAILSLSFVFAVTAQEFLGSCIFLFVKHPFDVGDRVDIRNGPDIKQLQVEKISLLYTVFTRIDINQLVQVPNIVLNALWIENISRARNQQELININVSFDTSFEDIELLHQEMEKFVRHPDNARDFAQDLTINCGGVNDLDKLTLEVCIKHKSNWHNERVRATRRSKFMCALALALKRVPIYAPGEGSAVLGSWQNPQYNVSVTDNTAKGYREQGDALKDAKRMVPIAATSAADKAQAEERAAQSINMRSVVVDACSQWGPDRDEFNEVTNRRGSEATADDTASILASHSLRKNDSKCGYRRAGDHLPGRSASISGAIVPSQSVRFRVSSQFDEEAAVGGTGTSLAPYPPYSSPVSHHTPVLSSTPQQLTHSPATTQMPHSSLSVHGYRPSGATIAGGATSISSMIRTGSVGSPVPPQVSAQSSQASQPVTVQQQKGQGTSSATSAASQPQSPNPPR